MANGKPGNGSRGPQPYRRGRKHAPAYPENLNAHQRFIISPETWQRMWHERFARESREKKDLIRDMTRVHTNDPPATLRKKCAQFRQDFREMRTRVVNVEKEMDRLLSTKRPSTKRIAELLSQKYFFQMLQNTISKHELITRLLLRRKVRHEFNSEEEQRARREMEDIEQMEKMLQNMRTNKTELQNIARAIIREQEKLD